LYVMYRKSYSQSKTVRFFWPTLYVQCPRNYCDGVTLNQCLINNNNNNNKCALINYNLESLISVHDDGDEDAENDVDEQTDEEVEVDAAVPPHQIVYVAHRRKRREDVVAVNKTEQTLGRCRHVTELSQKAQKVKLEEAYQPTELRY